MRAFEGDLCLPYGEGEMPVPVLGGLDAFVRINQLVSEESFYGVSRIVQPTGILQTLREAVGQHKIISDLEWFMGDSVMKKHSLLLNAYCCLPKDAKREVQGRSISLEYRKRSSFYSVMEMRFFIDGISEMATVAKIDTQGDFMRSDYRPMGEKDIVVFNRLVDILAMLRDFRRR